MRQLFSFSMGLFMGLFLFVPASSQYVEQRWSENDGLPSNDIFDIAQTPDGFIWVATDNGLARFDGVNFKIFDRTNTPEFSRNLIRKLHVSGDGTLYVGISGGGIVTYRNNEFIREFDEYINEGTYVLSFADNNEGLWIGTDGSGLYLAAEDTVYSWQGETLPRNHIFALQAYGDNQVAGSILGNGLWHFGGRNPQHVHTATNELIYDFTSHGNRLWMATSGQGVYLYDKDTNRAGFQHFPMRNLSETSHIATSILRDKTGRIWVGTAEGIFFTDDEFRNVAVYQGLEKSFSLSIFEDREGNIWIGDWGQGLLRLKPGSFSVLTEKDGLPEGATSSAAWYNDSLWVATQFGLYARDNNGYRVYTSSDGLNSSNPQLLFRDSRNRLIISYFGPGSGIDIYENGRFTWHQFFEDPEANPNVYVIHEDSDGTILIGSNSGLLHFSESEDIMLTSQEDGLVNNVVRSLLRHGSTLWIGTNGGLHALHDGQERVEHIPAPGGTMGSIITAIYIDNDENLWIGTFDNGLTLIRNGEFYNFNTENGLPTDVVWQIVEDENGYFWMGSTSGITRVNRLQLLQAVESGTMRAIADRFGFQDGLLGTSIFGNHQPTVLQHDGRIYFPSSVGLAFVDPQNIVKNMTEPPIVIQDVLLDLELYEVKNNRIEVAHDVRALEIQYTSPTFTAPQSVQFKYRLSPYDTQWQEVGNRRTAYFTSIPHGRYTFEVKAINENGVESSQAAVIPIIVRPAIWETWWFYGLLILLVFGIAYGSYRYKVYNFTRMNNLRLRISKDLHDEIGSNLASIAIRSSVVKKRELSSPQTVEDLDEIRNLSRLTAESMRDIVWLINPDNDTMENLVIKLREFCSNMLMEIEWTFDTNIENQTINLQIQKRRTIILIAKEVLHNIVKHARATKVDIRFEWKDGTLGLSIKDDGKGFEPGNLQSSGLGLRSMKERAADVGGIFDISSSPGKGTRITLEITA